MRKVLLLLLMVTFLSGPAFARTVAYWQLDGASDNLDAVLANGPDNPDLTLFGTMAAASAAVDPIPNPGTATWKWQAGDAIVNAAAQFFAAGAGWYLDTANTDLLFHNDQSFTVECWFSTGATNGYLCGNRQADSYLVSSGWFSGWQLWSTFAGQKITVYAEGNPNLMQGGIGSEVILEAAISRNTWYHVAFVWDHDDGPTGTMKLYLDGTLIDSAPGDAAWSGTTGGSWSIGQRNLWVDEGDLGLGTFWGNTGFDGNIDEVRFVDEALTPDQFLNGTTAYSDPQDLVADGDIDLDGDVDLFDFQKFTEDWLKNTHPDEPDAINLND